MQKALTREELAKKVGVTRQTLSLWENQHTIPTVENLVKLAEVLGEDVKTVLDALSEEQTLE
jgi:transcriptional regulator with XRE-family HTH domain